MLPFYNGRIKSGEETLRQGIKCDFYESFNRRMRDEFLNESLFKRLYHIRLLLPDVSNMTTAKGLNWF